MVERLKDKPFALIGINSDGDRDVSKAFDEKEQTALRGLAKSVEEALEQVRGGDAAFLAKAEKAVPGIATKVREADLLNLRGIMQKNGITWKQAAQGSTTGPLPRRWNVRGWPTIYVLDAQGVIRHRDLRDQQLEDAAAKLLEDLGKGAKR